MDLPPESPLASLLARLEDWLRQGRWTQARELEARLVQRAGGDPRLWRGLAAARLRLGDSRGAVQAARRASALAPADGACARLLARALVFNGRWAEAARIAEAAAGADAGAEALADLAGLLLEAGRPDLAEPLARRAVEASPQDGAHHRLLASAARQTGDVDTARTHIDAALALDPADDEALWLRSDLNLGAADGRAIDDLKRRVDARPSALALFALGRELERRGDDAAAFEAVARAAALTRAGFAYDVERDVRDLEARRVSHSAAAMRSPGLSTPEVTPIFVLGLPRTGSSLIERVLSAHSQVTSLGEPPAFDRAVLDLAAEAGAQDAEAGRLRALELDPSRLGETYLDVLARPRGWVVDKRPLNVLHVAAIRAALPGARIVLVERDLTDAGWAIFKTPFAGGAYPYSYDLAETGRYLAAHQRLVEHWRREFRGDILTLRYEDLIADFAANARRLVDFCGLPWEDACLRFHESAAATTSASAMQVRRPIYASSVGLSRRYARELGPLTEALQGAR